MKKITFVLLISMIAWTSSAHALSIFTETYMEGGTTYTVVDRSHGPDVANGSGGYTAGDYTGSYIGTLVGGNNDNLLDTTWASIISDYLDTPYTVTGISKVDAPSASSGDLAVTYDSSLMSGTWSTAGSDPAVAVNFFSVKGAKEFAIYYVDPAVQDGIWTTRHLLTPLNPNNPDKPSNIPGISHLSADLTATATDPPPAPVPEPATMLLLGSGLIGLAGIGRKKLTR